MKELRKLADNERHNSFTLAIYDLYKSIINANQIETNYYKFILECKKLNNYNNLNNHCIDGFARNQDATEFLISCLGKLEEENMKYNGLNLRFQYLIKIKSTISCPGGCFHPSVEDEATILNLSIPFGSNIDLDQCINKYVQSVS